ncbi:cytidylate kinase family protein [Candidatus Parvarchaeota archaeon]|nr:cytidylate kinase family protein [Candidatus Parvarchaeota archaeon]
MRIIISGLTASGKSTLAKRLADYFGLEYFSASSKLRDIMKYGDFKFWESKKGIEAVKFRLKHPEYDRKLDAYVLSYLKKHDNIVMDSWVASWKFYGKAIKIYLKSDLETRARRVSSRDSTPYKSALKFMREKDKLTTEVYRKLYKMDIINDMSPFDLVIDSSELSMPERDSICISFISALSRK